MKPQLLLISFLCAAISAGFAQSLSLSNPNGPVVPNSTIIQTGTPDSNTLLTYLSVTNTGSNTINVVCRKTLLTMLDSTHIYLCWANYCYAPHIHLSPDSVPVAPDETYSGFKAIYAQMAYNNFFIGESMVRYTFFDQDNASDSVSVTVRYQTFPVGIGDVTAMEELKLHLYPNPATAIVGFDYSVPAGSRGTMEIRDALGTLVQTQDVAGNSGHLTEDVAGLGEGIYFCSLRADGKPMQTRKLIVQ